MAGSRFHSMPWWKGRGLCLDARPDGLHTYSVGAYQITQKRIQFVLFESLPRMDVECLNHYFQLIYLQPKSDRYKCHNEHFHLKFCTLMSLQPLQFARWSWSSRTWSQQAWYCQPVARYLEWWEQFSAIVILNAKISQVLLSMYRFPFFKIVFHTPSHLSSTMLFISIVSVFMTLSPLLPMAVSTNLACWFQDNLVSLMSSMFRLVQMSYVCFSG